MEEKKNEKEIPINSSRHPAWKLIKEGNSYYEKGEIEKAKDLYETSAIIFLENDFLFEAADLFESIGNIEKSKEIWLELAIRSEKSEDWQFASVGFRKAGELEKAKECIIRVIEICEHKREIALSKHLLRELEEKGVSITNEEWKSISDSYNKAHDKQKFLNLDEEGRIFFNTEGRKND